jgi:hypothetical protein
MVMVMLDVNSGRRIKVVATGVHNRGEWSAHEGEEIWFVVLGGCSDSRTGGGGLFSGYRRETMGGEGDG